MTAARPPRSMCRLVVMEVYPGCPMWLSEPATNPTCCPFSRYRCPNQRNVPHSDMISTSRCMSASPMRQSPGAWAWGIISTSSGLFSLRRAPYRSARCGTRCRPTRQRPCGVRKYTLWCPPRFGICVHSYPSRTMNSPSLLCSATDVLRTSHSLSSIQRSCSERQMKSSRESSLPNLKYQAGVPSPSAIPQWAWSSPQ